MKELATIIYCMKNREKFVNRYLKISKNMGYQYEFIIIKEKRANYPIIPKEISYKIFEIDSVISGMADIFKSLEIAYEYVNKFNYCHFVEDDNFVFPKTIKKLISKKKTKAITGEALIYNRTGEKEVNPYYLVHVKSKSIIKRIEEYNQNGGLAYYSIFNRDLFIEICEIVKQCNDNNLSEVLFNYLAVIKTNISKINCLYLCREYPRPKVYNIPDSLNWITQNKMPKELEKVLSLIEENINKVEKLERNYIFRLTLGHYLSKRFDPNKKNKIKNKNINKRNYSDELDKYFEEIKRN